MGQYLDNLKIGDTVLMRGPTGARRYGLCGPGSFTHLIPKNRKDISGIDTICCLAGGTGITPMLQICNHVIRDENDKTKIILIVANRTADDVMLKDQLLALPERSKGNIK